MRENTYFRLFLWSMAIFSFVVVLFFGTGAHASQVTSKTFVDSIKISKSELVAGEDAVVEIHFSEKPGHKFKPGDQLAFELPKELKGFKNSMLLEDYAQVVVESGRVTVTFTDKTATKKNIKGIISFAIKVKNDLDNGSSKVIPLDFGTNVHDVPLLKVKGHPRNDGDGTGERDSRKPDPAYKVGAVDENDPTLLTWYIVINAAKDHISGTIDVTDSLSKGHEYLPDSFEIIGKIGMNSPKVTITGNSFTVQLPAGFADGEYAQIKYQTKIIGAGMKMEFLENAFFTKFDSNNNVPGSVSGNAKIKNLIISGKIEGEDDLVPKHGKEETLEPIPEGKLEDIEPIVPEHGKEGIQGDHLEKGIRGSKPEVHNLPKIEELPEEDLEELIPIDPIVPERGHEEVEKQHHEDGIRGSKPEVHNLPKIEELPEDELEELIPIDPIVPERGQEEIEKPHHEDGIRGSKPEVHNLPKVEELPKEELEESIPIDPIIPRHIDSKVVENELEKAKKILPPIILEDVVVPEKPINPMPKTKEPKSKDVNSSFNKKKISKTTSKNELPNTGSSTNFGLIVLGLIGLLFSVLSKFRRTK